MSDKSSCKGQCTACNIECELRSKDYNPQWDSQGLDRLLEDVTDLGYTKRRIREDKFNKD